MSVWSMLICPRCSCQSFDCFSGCSLVVEVGSIMSSMISVAGRFPYGYCLRVWVRGSVECLELVKVW